MRRNGQTFLDAIRSLDKVLELCERRQQARRFRAGEIRPEVQRTEAMRARIQQIDGFRHRVGRHIELGFQHTAPPEVRSGIAHGAKQRRIDRLVARLVAG